MSRYAVYELFNGCEAPSNISTFGGHLAGVKVGTCDDNPLYRRPNTPDKFKFNVDNEFSPSININVRPQAEED